MDPQYVVLANYNYLPDLLFTVEPHPYFHTGLLPQLPQLCYGHTGQSTKSRTEEAFLQ